MEIRKIGVIGGGAMGRGITQVAAQSGFEVVMRDLSQPLVDKAVDAIGKGLDRLLAKEKISAGDRSDALGRIQGVTELSAMADCDVVIEAATEDLDTKLAVFRELDGICGAEAILASNTSSLSLTRIASQTGRPGQVVGMHFFNPVPVMKLVEVVRALQTRDDVMATISDLARQLGKVPVDVKDSPGFVVNRLLVPMINEAAFLLYEGLASAEEIDEAMKLGAAHPMGPLALADMVGVDVCLAVMQVLQEGFGDPKFRPCPLMVRMVDAGHIGRKSGRGFYDYSGG
jgi:3-hydroxybutyryl-CoA dehydrogenase